MSIVFTPDGMTRTGPPIADEVMVGIEPLDSEGAPALGDPDRFWREIEPFLS